MRGVDIETIVRRFALAGGLMATLGIAQYVTRQSLVDRIAIPGLTASYESGTNFRNGLIRVAGTATHPIEFGALLTILLPIALHVALHSHGLGRFRRWFPAATIFVALGLSGSRSAYIGLVVVLVVLLLGWPRRLRMVVGPTSVVVLVLMCLALPPLFRSVRNMFVGAKDDPSIASRTDSYAIAVQFVERWPFFGHGLGTFLPKYRVFDNAYLGLLVSVGIVGTIAFVAIPVTAIWLLLRRRRLWIDERSRDLALSLAAGIAAGSVSLAFFDGFGFPMMMGTMLLTLGISGALLAVRGRSQLPPPDWWPPSGRAEPRHASQDPVELPVPRAHGDQSGVLSDGSRAP
ncbi:O-antigen ligase family protein [Cellulomonas sp. ICMP 17802]|uniref:O-antigen ligase family protein n=1 Tax=Cellulomonas sp. ICMP 17802 TaxID=3239199 RepID=UPI00351B5548